MQEAVVSPLFAVHISDGVLSELWLLGGFVLAALLALFGAWRIRDEEIPHVAVMTAAFFVASLIHVRVGPTSVHLLLNGLLGVVLGRRAAVAIPVGLVLQAALLQHGGFTALGVNSCVLVVPALLSWQLFGGLRRMLWLRQSWCRAGLVMLCTLLWILTLVYSVTLLFSNRLNEFEYARAMTFHPLTVLVAAGFAGLAAWTEKGLENAPEFPLGLLVGEVSVLITVLLNFLVLSGQEDLHTLALVILVAHLPIAVIEGLVVGFTVGFLVRVKPEMLGVV